MLHVFIEKLWQSPSLSQDFADKMKIFFAAILIAVAAAAQVTLKNLAISHIYIGSKFTSMTDEERSEATKSLAEDWWKVFRYVLL